VDFLSLWRLLDLEFADPFRNMAVEESIFINVDENTAPNTLRFWRNKHTVVIGCSQKVNEVVDLEYCKIYGITIVRRFTGGGAIYQDFGNLNWTVVVHRRDRLSPSKPLEIFKVFSEAVIRGLKLLGVDARFQCPNIITVNGKKISGLAAYVKKNAVLCHGTLLIDIDLHTLSRVLPLHRNSPMELTCVRDELENKVSLNIVKKYIMRGFNEAYEIKVKSLGLSADEELLAETLCVNKYSRAEWNLRY